MINECFTNIRYVKMTAAENYFLDKITTIKAQELKNNQIALNRSTLASFISFLFPDLVMIMFVVLYAFFKYETGIEFKTVFTIVLTYKILLEDLRLIPDNILCFVN